MEEQGHEPEEEVTLPEDRVEDLAPEADESNDVSGGVQKHIGNVKYEDIK